MAEIEIIQRLQNALFYLPADHDRVKLDEIKNILNQLFSSEEASMCQKVIYTNNTDNLFFGVRVYPEVSGYKPMNFASNDGVLIKNHYKIELDSKLFDALLGLSKESLSAIVLYNVFHTLLVSNYKLVIANIDVYIAETGEDLELSRNDGMGWTFGEILAYGIQDALMKLGNVFTKGDSRLLIDDKFLSKYGLNYAMKDALISLATHHDFMRKEVDERFITLSWCLRLITNYSLYYTPAIKTLRRLSQLTVSELEKNNIKRVLVALNSVHENFYDDINTRDNPEYLELKQNGIHDELNTTYELLLNLKACEDSDDCLNIIRKVNNKIELLYAYLEEDLSDEERAITERVLQDLFHVRQEASKNKTLKDRLPRYLQPSYSAIDPVIDN